MTEIYLSHEEYYQKMFCGDLVYVGINIETLATYVEDQKSNKYYKVIYIMEKDQFCLEEVDIDAEDF